jgi:hypothetical protein
MKEKRSLEISHFLDHKEFAKAYWNEDFHPLEITVKYHGHIIQLRSKICDFLKIYQSDIRKLTRSNPKACKYIMQGYFTEEIFGDIMNERQFPVFDLLMDEIELITRIIEFYEPFDINNFTTRNFAREYIRHTTEIMHILDDTIKDMYVGEMKGLFAKNIDPAKSKEVFRISNYFIHYINWDNTFHDFCEMTFDVMPKSYRLVENYLTDHLKISIKAYMAFITQANILRRQFEKLQPGKISILSYFEWEDHIMEFLLKKFQSIFGAKKARQYVESLNQVLLIHMRDSSLTC